jgi:hypothetical protein
MKLRRDILVDMESHLASDEWAASIPEKLSLATLSSHSGHLEV